MAVEEVQKHRLPRIPLEVPVSLFMKSSKAAAGSALTAQLLEYSQQEVRIAADASVLAQLAADKTLVLELASRGERHRFEARVTVIDEAAGAFEAALVFHSSREEIAFAREGMWAIPPKGHVDDHFVAGFLRLGSLAIYGYKSLIEFLPGSVGRAIRFILSLLPRVPRAAA